MDKHWLEITIGTLNNIHHIKKLMSESLILFDQV